MTRGCPGRSSNTANRGTTKVSRPIKAPIRGEARPSPGSADAGPGEASGCAPPTPGGRSSASTDWTAGLALASHGPGCWIGPCSSIRLPAQRSSETGWLGKASTEPRLWDSCGDRGGGSESMEWGKEQVQQRCRRRCAPGRDEAEQPAEDLGRPRRTGSQSLQKKEAKAPTGCDDSGTAVEAPARGPASWLAPWPGPRGLGAHRGRLGGRPTWEPLEPAA